MTYTCNASLYPAEAKYLHLIPHTFMQPRRKGNAVREKETQDNNSDKISVFGFNL